LIGRHRAESTFFIIDTEQQLVDDGIIKLFNVKRIDLNSLISPQNKHLVTFGEAPFSSPLSIKIRVGEGKMSFYNDLL
jgi:hypothetical protein